jgi:hypothetical protein
MPKIVTTLLVLVLTLLPVETAVGQPTVLGYPGYSVDTNYSQPANLGHSMFVAVNVTNLSYYIVASVDSVKLTFDWGAILTGSTPWPLQPRENNTWRFDQVDIPLYTWTGRHVCLIDLMVSFSYPTWRLGRILTYQNASADGEIPIQFEVQGSPSSGMSTTMVGPRLIRAISNTTTSSNQAGTSLISLVYRGGMVAFLVIAIFLLARRPHLSDRSPKTEKKQLDQSDMQH